MKLSIWYEQNRSRFGTVEEAAMLYAKKHKKSYQKTLSALTGKINTVLPTIKRTLSEKDLKALYDPYYKIEQAAKSLKDGQFVTEPDFRECFAKLNTTAFRRSADNEMFAQYKGRAGNKIYWGSLKSIEKMKNEGVLS